MRIHDLIQGSRAWLQYRASHFNASDAPAMMGCSPYKTRAELLREMHTGVVPEVDIATRKRFDNGHRAEALARPLAEGLIGEPLFPVVGSQGRLAASFDGLERRNVFLYVVSGNVRINGRDVAQHNLVELDLDLFRQVFGLGARARSGLADRARQVVAHRADPEIERPGRVLGILAGGHEGGDGALSPPGGDVGRGGGRHYTVHVNVPPNANLAEVGRVTVNAIREFERRYPDITVRNMAMGAGTGTLMPTMPTSTWYLKARAW